MGKSGRVISVDADQINIGAIYRNFKHYEKITGRHIELLEGAVWRDNEGIQFSTEGNMGASCVDYVDDYRGDKSMVKSFTLSKIAEIYQLNQVDFIKCDIEGAEAVIFNDKAFFKKYNPRIIIETHLTNQGDTMPMCIEVLSTYGYTCKKIEQLGVSLPLLECYPAEKLMS